MISFVVGFAWLIRDIDILSSYGQISAYFTAASGILCIAACADHEIASLFNDASDDIFLRSSPVLSEEGAEPQHEPPAEVRPPLTDEEVQKTKNPPNEIPSAFAVSRLVNPSNTKGNQPEIDAEPLGLASARFNKISSLEVVENQIYVADTLNNGIKRVDIFSETVAWFAGNGAGGGLTDGVSGLAEIAPTALTISTPDDLLYDEDNDYLYFISHSSRVARIKLSGKTQTVDIEVAGDNRFHIDNRDGLPLGSGKLPISAIRLMIPAQLALSGDYVFVSDPYNFTIRKINLTAVIENGVRMRLNENVIIHQDDNFQMPFGVAMLGDDLYISDQMRHQIYHLENAAEVLADSEDRIYAKLFAGSRIPFSSDEIGERAAFHQPSKMLVAGNFIYVIDQGSNSIRVIDKSGVVKTPELNFLLDAEPSDMEQLRDLAHYQDEDFFLASDNQILKLQAII